MYDIAAGSRHVAGLVRRRRIDIVHGRAHVGAAICALVKKRTGARLIFDIRGFNPEEYVDAGVWSENGLKYKLSKRAERAMLKTADGFVILTDRAKTILFPNATEQDSRGRPIEVIPCCVDTERFASAASSREQTRHRLGLDGRNVIVYVGALGGTYLSHELAQFLASAVRRDARTFAMILTQSDPISIKDSLRATGVSDNDCLIKRVSPVEIPSYLSASDLAVSFIRPSYSKIASSPTKIPEYLMAGLPVICNAGVGDCDEVITTDRVGVLIDDLTETGFDRTLDQAIALKADPHVSNRCRESARRRFDISNVGGARYCRLYERVMSPNYGDALA
jgi:glycosyltransferase involved in cell wall biosynthesis